MKSSIAYVALLLSASACTAPPPATQVISPRDDARTLAKLETSEWVVTIPEPSEESVQLTAMAFDTAGFPMVDEKVAWSSLDPQIVTVDGTGRIRAVGPGRGSIVAKAGDIERRVTVQVGDLTEGPAS